MMQHRPTVKDTEKLEDPEVDGRNKFKTSENKNELYFPNRWLVRVENCYEKNLPFSKPTELANNLKNSGVFKCNCREAEVNLRDLINREQSLRETCRGVGLLCREY
jgi:hypothetical protein